MTDPVATMNISKEAKWAIVVLSGKMNFIWNIYDADLSNLKELFKAGTRQS